MKQIVETYEQGTGKLIDTYEIEVPEIKPKIDIATEIDDLKARVDELEKK